MPDPQLLVIEDDRLLGELYVDILKEKSVTCELIYDGDQALQRLKEITPAVILLDLHLPYISGLDVLEQIHSEPRFANTKVIVATADGVRAKEVSHLVQVVFLKPVDYSQLINTVLRLLAE
jgi:DNA-binding response OmpR family regulator